MLDELRQETIKQEEIYRIEVQKQFSENKKTGSHLWIFLNSTFGLWLLSALLITWGTSLYTAHQSRVAEDHKNTELVERLDLEIGYRFSQLQIHIASLVEWKGSHPSYSFIQGKSENDLKFLIDGLSTPPLAGNSYLYDEFSKMSALALIAELRRHVPKPEKAELDQVIADMSGIYIFLEVKQVPLTNAHDVAMAIFDRMMLPRWRAGKYYFSDCPFC